MLDQGKAVNRCERRGWGWGRGRGCCRREHGVGSLLELVRLESTTLKDVLPPEGQEELQIGLVNEPRRVGRSVGGGHTGEDGGDGGAVRGEGLELVTAALRHLWNTPGRGAGGLDGHDERPGAGR
jgi:hypothetical protein